MAYNAKSSWRKIKDMKKEKEISQFVRDEKEAKRICGSIARMIREFWQNVDKVVDFRANVKFLFYFFILYLYYLGDCRVKKEESS